MTWTIRVGCTRFPYGSYYPFLRKKRAFFRLPTKNSRHLLKGTAARPKHNSKRVFVDLASCPGCIMTNPWADAVSKESVSERSFSMDDRGASAMKQQRRRYEKEPEGCGAKTLRSSVKALHVMDGAVGFSLLVYGLVISSSPARTAVVFVYTTSALLLLRAAVGLMALYTTMCQRYGLVMSGYLSPLFGFLLFVLSMLCWGFHDKVFRYLQHHSHQLRLPARFARFWSRHAHFVWVTLLVFAVLEALRWWLVRSLRQRLLESDDDGVVVVEDVSVRSNHRPWWWRRRTHSDGLGDPLLPPSAQDLNPHWSSVRGSSYEIHDGVEDLQRAERKRQRGWLSRFFGGKDAGDDLSEAEFASIHEEWASRSEEDPLWWSREEEEGGGGVGEKDEEQKESPAKSEEEKKDVSWVEGSIP